MHVHEIALVVATAIVLAAAPTAAQDGKAQFERSGAGCHGTSGHADTEQGRSVEAKDSRESDELTGARAIGHAENATRRNDEQVRNPGDEAALAVIARCV